jgi:hypothetical protein
VSGNTNAAFTAAGSNKHRSKTVSLKFPNARLYVHELLSSERLSGAQAIVRGSCRFGLISEDCIADLLQSRSGRECQCLATAKDVVSKHFAQRFKQSAPVVDWEEVWRAIEKHFNNHLPITEKKSTADCCKDGSVSTCNKHAPALLDMMLQQIMRYP